MKNKSNFVKVSKYTCWCMLMMFLMVLTPMRAQTSRSISGQVVDELGEAIIGANVTVVGNKSLCTITDIYGNFTLTVPQGPTLEVSYIGYVNKKVVVDNKTSYKITLKEDAEQLDEVVVVGYGTQKRVNLTGAVSAITNEELDARIIAHLKREERLHRKTEQRFYGDLVIDYASKCVHMKEKTLDLTKLEYDIIEFLSMNPEIVFDKERIYEKIGGYDAEGDSRVVTELIRRIRKKMKMYSEHEYIETVWGMGYKWAK